MAAGCFIAGTSLSSLVFGNVIHHFTNSLRPLAIATLLWASAAVVTGVSRTFWLLLLTRIISGPCQGLFNCVVPMFIDDKIPPVIILTFA